ncbi:MAG: class I SAM-dependent methyltransferase [Planctomycetes bacterium]|nr:class I SAM-dependent methyltransferase [Planctomycetota bacterium]
MNSAPPITFSFGANWQSFLEGLDARAVEAAIADTRTWLDDADLAGRSVLDIGCGSGLGALAISTRGPAALISFDADPRSVAATRSLWTRAGQPPAWQVLEGSVLDRTFLDALAAGTPDGAGFAVVHSWGVLHHTGALWTAMDNAARLLMPGGVLWISLYAHGPHYARDLRLKQRYNAAGRFGKWAIARCFVLRIMLLRLRHRQNPFAWSGAKARGMDGWHDVLDWLGGLPYEVASIDEVVAWATRHGLVLTKVQAAAEGSCHVFRLRRPA